MSNLDIDVLDFEKEVQKALGEYRDASGSALRLMYQIQETREELLIRRAYIEFALENLKKQEEKLRRTLGLGESQ